MSLSPAAVLGQLKHTLFQDVLVALDKGTSVLRNGRAVVELVQSMVGKVIAKQKLAILGAQLTEQEVRSSSIPIPLSVSRASRFGIVTDDRLHF